MVPKWVPFVRSVPRPGKVLLTPVGFRFLLRLCMFRACVCVCPGEHITCHKCFKGIASFTFRGSILLLAPGHLQVQGRCGNEMGGRR